MSKATEGLHSSNSFGNAASSARIRALCTLMTNLYDAKNECFIEEDQLTEQRKRLLQK